MSLSNRRAMLGSGLKGIPNNEIWYTNGSTTTKTEPNKTDAFGVGIISNTYDVIHKCWRLKFNGKVTSIGYKAFYNCSSLTSVTIPDSVTTIGEDAFNYCRSLTSVNIPDSVTTIGEDAFFNCSSLTSVTIPDSVTTIGHGAFYGCAGELIVNCKIPSVSYSSDGTFYGSKFTSVTIGDSVTAIGDWAFYMCDSLTSITIPDSVTTIGDYAFRECSSLTSVTIPDSVTEIGKYTFYKCSSLTSVTIGDSVTTIGANAFYECSNLTSITIGDSVTTIKDYAFYYCSSLTSVTIPESVTAIGQYAFYGCGAGELIVNCNIIPYASRDYEGAFYSSNFTSVTIGDGVTEIGSHAFMHCNRLTSLTIPDSVTTIGEYAFAYCNRLTSLTIPDSVTSIGNYAFAYCSSLTSVTIGDSVTTIGDEAFYNCSKINNIIFKCNIPNSTFSNNEFYGVTLSDEYTVSIGKDNTDANKVLSVGTDAFVNADKCNLIINSDLYEGSTLKTSTFYNRKFKSITINKIGTTTTFGITKSKSNIFYNCYSDVVTVNCNTSAGTVSSSPTGGGVGIPSGGSSNNSTPTFNDISTNAVKGAFYGSKFKRVIFTDNVKTIGSCAFYECTTIENIHGGNNISEIESYAFKGCTSLKTLGTDGYNQFYVGGRDYTGNIIKQVKIGDYAFSGCENIDSLSFAGNCQDIGDGAFYNCGITHNDNYDTLNFNYGLKNIGNYAFKNCKTIRYVDTKTIHDNEYTIGHGAFLGCEKLTTFYYQGFVQWANTSSSGTYGLRKISDSLFEGCTSLTSIYYYFDDSIRNSGICAESIGDFAFYKCESLNNSSISFIQCIDSIKIGHHAFSECTSITTLYINNSQVNKIDDFAFENCTSLTNVSFECTSSIDLGVGVFNGCTNIKGFTNLKSTLSNKTSEYLCGGNTLYAVAWAHTNIKDKISISVNSTYLSYYGTGNTKYYVSYINDYAFYQGSFSSITFRSGLKTIGDHAFYNCYNLSGVTIPDNVTTIGEWAFANCISLTNVTIGNSVTTIGDSAFANCSEIIKVSYKGTIDKWVSIDFNNKKSNPLYYGTSELYTYNSNNTLIEISKLVSSTGSKNGDLLIDMSSNDTNKAIKQYAFCGAYASGKIDSIIIKGATSIGVEAFSGMGMKNIVIDDACQTIGTKAFYDCINIKNIQIGGSASCSLRVIGDYAFATTQLTVKADGVENYLHKFVVFRSSGITITSVQNIFENRIHESALTPFTIHCYSNDNQTVGVWSNTGYTSLWYVQKNTIDNLRKFYGFKNNNANTGTHWTDIGTDYNIY